MIFKRRNPVSRSLSVFIIRFMICTLVVGINVEGRASTASNEKPVKNEENGLTLSDMQVIIEQIHNSIKNFEEVKL